MSLMMVKRLLLPDNSFHHQYEGLQMLQDSLSPSVDVHQVLTHFTEQHFSVCVEVIGEFIHSIRHSYSWCQMVPQW